MNRIKYNDILEWIERFQRTKGYVNTVLRFDRAEPLSREELQEIEYALNDALYLVALIESKMSIKEPYGVLKRARELQEWTE